MPALGPRETEPDAWIAWIREAVLLLKRRPLTWLAWTAVSLVLLYVGHRATWVPIRAVSLYFLMPMSLMVYIRVAWCADYSKPAGWSDILPTNQDCGLAIGIGVVMVAVATAFGTVLSSMASDFRELVMSLGLYQEILDSGLPAPPPLRYTLMGPLLVPGLLLGLALGTCLTLILAFGQWFALPMLVLHQSPLIPSMVSSARAYPLNPVPMMGLAGVVLIAAGLTAASLGWLVIVLLPFSGALLYTAYRDVYLGRDASEPAKAVEPHGRASGEYPAHGFGSSLSLPVRPSVGKRTPVPAPVHSAGRWHRRSRRVIRGRKQGRTLSR